jgi:hypothetical protein
MKLMRKIVKSITSSINTETINNQKNLEADTLFAASNNEPHRWMSTYGFNTVLDIGANEGQFAKKITDMIPGIKLICFEPLAEPYKILKNLFSDNKNLFYQYALGANETEINIFRNEYSPSSSLLPMAAAHKKNFTFARKEFPEKIQIKPQSR